MKNNSDSLRSLTAVGRPALLSAAIVAALSTAYTPTTWAGATFKIDDTKWISVGAGLRTSFSTREDGAGGKGNRWSSDWSIDNLRLYINAQIHEYIKLEFNTECIFCNNGGEMRILDGVGKFEIDPMFNVWVGRQLVPAERRELNGPFYSAVYNIFGAGTPFEPSDFNLVFSTDGTSAGAIGRDDGVNIWGSFFDGHLQYAVGAFQGLRNGANRDDNFLYAQRIAYNFLDVEKNPGYYTSGTYYGKGGEILTLGVANQYQEDGAGTRDDPGNFRGTTVDLLYETSMLGPGVFTFNGEYKNYGIRGFDMASREAVKAGAATGFAMFEGDAYDFSAMYLLPDKVWIGQFQPYVRYVGVNPVKSASRDVYEAGLNYVIDGHNARVSLIYEYGDLLTKGLDYTSTASGKNVSQILLGLQLQI